MVRSHRESPKSQNVVFCLWRFPSDSIVYSMYAEVGPDSWKPHSPSGSTFSTRSSMSILGPEQSGLRSWPTQTEGVGPRWISPVHRTQHPGSLGALSTGKGQTLPESRRPTDTLPPPVNNAPSLNLTPQHRRSGHPLLLNQRVEEAWTN